MTDSSSLLEFPCRFPIKAMGRSDSDFEATVTAIVTRHAALTGEDAVQVRASGEGNFLSVTLTIEAQSREQLDRIYQDLTATGRALMAL